MNIGWRRGALVLTSALALLLAACSPNEDRAPADEPLGTASIIEGRGTLLHDGKTTELLTDAAVSAGDTLSVEEGDIARVMLSGRRDFELRGGSLELKDGDTVVLRSGSLLADAGSNINVQTAAATASFTAGKVRFDGPVVGRIGAYDAENLKVAGGSQTVDVPRYWQVTLGADGRLDMGRPLLLSGDDVWDQRLLSNALETDASLANFATGFDAQFGTTTPPALLQRLNEVGVGAEGLAPFAGAKRSNLVLALAFAREWKPDDQIPQGFFEALTLNTLGASWGLLAEQFGVDPSALVTAFQAEINSIPIVPEPAPTPPTRPTRRPVVRPSPAPPAIPPAPVQPVPGATPSPSSGGGNPDSILPLLPEDLRRVIDELYGIVEDLLPII